MQVQTEVMDVCITSNEVTALTVELFLLIVFEFDTGMPEGLVRYVRMFSDDDGTQ